MKVYPIRKKDDRDKIELILKAKDKRAYTLWSIGVNTGLRISDILKLTVADVKGDFIQVTEQKTSKNKIIKINKKLKAIIKDFIKGMNNDRVLFESRVGVNRAITVRRAQQIIKSIAETVGVENNVNSHSMRKTYAYLMYKATGNNIALVMEALNHSSEKITLRYLCLAEEMLDDATELIGNM